MRSILYNFHSKSVFIKPATQGNLSKSHSKLFKILFNPEANYLLFPTKWFLLHKLYLLYPTIRIELIPF